MKLLKRIFSTSSPVKLLGEQIPMLNYSGTERSMQCVYTLSEELRRDPRQQELAQTLTLDSSRPHLGLRGTYGLFASKEWWDAINCKRLPLSVVSGVIARVYKAGQDRVKTPNTVEINMVDGEKIATGIYVNDSCDVQLFQPGRYVELIYALDRLKNGNISRIALEMAVSVEPQISRNTN